MKLEPNPLNAKRAPQVAEQMARLMNLSEKLLATQSELAERLSPVMHGNCREAACPGTDTPVMVPLASQLHECCKRLELAIDRDNQMLEAMEL